MSYKLDGKWKAGWALDVHTLGSTVNSDGTYNTVRTQIGEALFLLKYRDDRSQVTYLINELVNFLKTRLVLPYIDVIIPVPASLERGYQPVYEICRQVGQQLGIPVDFNFISKIKTTPQLKSLDSVQEKIEILKDAFQIKEPYKYQNKKVLIIDDLFCSGTTLNEITKLLYEKANVQNVYVATLTKTRSKK